MPEDLSANSALRTVAAYQRYIDHPCLENKKELMFSLNVLSNSVNYIENPSGQPLETPGFSVTD